MQIDFTNGELIVMGGAIALGFFYLIVKKRFSK